jgi:phosphocarrier protein FPr
VAVGLVVVSHSRELAEAAVVLARGMLPGRELAVEVAAGDVDGGLGTDATAIADAVAAADSGDGVVVLMDLGSAVLSAETALELLDGDLRERTVLSPAALVEGLVGAAVTAAAGADRDRVATEALRGLAPKEAQLRNGNG